LKRTKAVVDPTTAKKATPNTSAEIASNSGEWPKIGNAAPIALTVRMMVVARPPRSSASTPEPRTSHNISNVEILSQSDSKVELRFNWLTLSYRYKIVDTYFGVSFYTLETAGERPLIKAKKVILKNDYIHHVIDIYHI